jgi:hypothetical protein
MFIIGLGRVSPTDACLCLIQYEDGFTKQYGIESNAWKLLEVWWDVGEQRMDTTANQTILKIIWDNFDEDIC